MTDPVADMLTRIRNGIQARAETIEVPASNLKVEVAKVLKAEGFIAGYRTLEDDRTPILRIELKHTDPGERAVRPFAQTKVLLCGDHSLYRAALRILVETRDDFRIVAESTWDTAAIEYALSREVDLILMDHELRPSTRAQLASLETLLDRFAPRPVVIVTSVIDPQACLTALRHGASGIVLKARGEETLLETMTSAARGQVVLEHEVLAAIFSVVAQAPDVPRIEQLKIDQFTPLEREIAEVACTSLTNKQIAEKLSISETTVRHHLGAIFSKLGVPVIRGIERASRPGRRVVLNGPFATRDDVKRVIDWEESLPSAGTIVKADLYDVLVETVTRSLGNIAL
jgi:DNA-binding NarL/FixJ family response regulator